MCSNHPDPLSPSTQAEPRVNRRLRLTPCPEMEEEAAEGPTGNNPAPVGSGAAGAGSSHLPPLGTAAADPRGSNLPLVTAGAGPSQQVRYEQQQEGMSQFCVWFIAVYVPLRTQLVWFNERQPPYQGSW